MKKQAQGKRIFDVAHHGFIMRKCKGSKTALPDCMLACNQDTTQCELMVHDVQSTEHDVLMLELWHIPCGHFGQFGTCVDAPNVCLSDVTGRAPMLPGNGVPVALGNDAQTPEEAEQALTEALTARIASLDAQLAKLGMLGQ